jgi:hypothetical protein
MDGRAGRVSTPFGTYVFATAAELRAIFARAFEAIDGVHNVDDDDDDHGDTDKIRRDNLRHEAAVEALRFCCLAAGQLGDASLLPLVVEAIEVCGHFNDHADDNPTTLGWGLAQLLERGAALDDDGRKLVTHRDARIRNALARSLLPRGEAELALLATLSVDPIPEVRNAAKETLQQVREVPWWTGKFASDPIARLTADEALEHKATLERISELLDLPRYSLAESEAELVELAEMLPDELAVEVALGVLEARGQYHLQFTELGTMLLTREGGEAAFIALCGRWNSAEHRFFMGKGLAAMVRALPTDVATAMCVRLAAAACSASNEERAKQMGSGARLLAETAGHAFPPGEDLTPLLDLALSLPVSEEKYAVDWVASGLAEAFSAEEADPGPVLDRVSEARLAGYPGPWKPLGRSLDQLLARASGAALRSLAERAMENGSDASVLWALGHILGKAHDPDRDPPAPALVARLFAEPRYRRILVDSRELSRLILPLLRAELREGRLDFAEAATTLRVVDTLYGGVGSRFQLRSYKLRDPIDPETKLAGERAKIAAFLGPEELHGPPTEQEWSLLRAARDRREAAADTELHELLNPLPEGPWAPEDRALLDRCLAIVRRGHEDAALHVASALAAKPDRELYPLFETLLTHGSSHCLPLIRSCRKAAAEELEIHAGAKAESAENPDQGDENDHEDEDGDVQWMDEPDE